MKPTLQNLRDLGVSDRVLRQQFTGVLSSVLDFTDLETALNFAFEYGGKQISLSKRADSKIGLRLGAQTVARLYDIYGPEKITVSHGPFAVATFQRLRTIGMLEAGASYNDIANALGIPRGTVRAIYAKFSKPESANA